MTCADRRNLCVGARPTAHLCWIWTPYINRAKCWNSFISPRHAFCAPNMTCAKWRNPWIGAVRLAAYLWWICPRNICRANWSSCIWPQLTAYHCI